MPKLYLFSNSRGPFDCRAIMIYEVWPSLWTQYGQNTKAREMIEMESLSFAEYY